MSSSTSFLAADLDNPVSRARVFANFSRFMCFQNMKLFLGRMAGCG